MNIKINSTNLQYKYQTFTSAKSIFESSKDWDKFYAAAIPSSLELNPVLFNYINPGDKILDVGMGFGKTIFDLFRKGFKNLSGVDSNQSGINFAYETIKNFKFDGNFKFLTANAKNLPFENCSQDAVITQAFWTTIVNNTDRKSVINEVNRVLKNKGILYIADFGQTPQIPKYKNRYEFGKLKGYDYGTFEVVNEKNRQVEYLAHHYTKDEFSELLKQAGFKIENYIVSPVKTRSGNTINGHTIIARKI